MYFGILKSGRAPQPWKPYARLSKPLGMYDYPTEKHLRET